MRTYRAEDLDLARRAWDSGEFADAWTDIRDRAAAAGIIFPPSGRPGDSWDVDRPSQRAIVAQADSERPQALRECIDASRSWAEVVARLAKHRTREQAERPRSGVEATRRYLAELESIGAVAGSLADHGVLPPGGGS